MDVTKDHPGCIKACTRAICMVCHNTTPPHPHPPPPTFKRCPIALHTLTQRGLSAGMGGGTLQLLWHQSVIGHSQSDIGHSQGGIGHAHSGISHAHDHAQCGCTGFSLHSVGCPKCGSLIQLVLAEGKGNTWGTRGNT